MPPAPAKAAVPAPNGAKKTAKQAMKKAAKTGRPGSGAPAAVRSKSDQTPESTASPATE